MTLITYGDRKAGGNKHQPLEKAALERFQADVDTIGELFVKTVARNRRMKATTVRGIQAGTYMGAARVQIGFVDEVMYVDEGFRSLYSQVGQAPRYR